MTEMVTTPERSDEGGDRGRASRATYTDRPARNRRVRIIMVLLAAILLVALCAVIIIIIYPIIFRLTADAGGPYTVDEAQSLTFDGSGSSGRNIVGYAWDFGDGSTDSGVSPSHTYYNGPAQFTVTLTVTDNRGKTASDTAQVTVNNLPPTADAGGPYTCQVGKTIQLSGTCDDPSPVDAASLTCTWAEFSGAAISQPSFTCPTTPGEVTVTLTATDPDGASAQDSATITVVTPTTLSADANGPYTGTVGVPVSFDGSGSTPADAIVSYDWDFGDGQTGTGVVISHTYAATGTYIVSLTVSDSQLQDTDTTTATIVANQPPTAVIELELIPKTTQCFRFTGSASTDADGKIVAYAWDFGDQNTDTGEVIEYCYAESGSYVVTLTVTDDGGATDSTSEEVEVKIP